MKVIIGERKCRILEKIEFKISTKEEDLPFTYWISKMHKNTFGQRLIVAIKLPNNFPNQYFLSLNLSIIKLRKSKKLSF